MAVNKLKAANIDSIEILIFTRENIFSFHINKSQIINDILNVLASSSNCLTTLASKVIDFNLYLIYKHLNSVVQLLDILKVSAIRWD